MSDIIQLLPESIANQIAAGEVVQRPASVVKELLENAVDAKSTEVTLVVKDAGKGLVHVVDNGLGMSETDARMSFERHATSKIRNANDLFSIRTMGFRGEALASIAAVAQVEMKSRRHDRDIGTCLQVEGSMVKKQEPVACMPGTSIAVKNLFYNVPARRTFLKSNAAEQRHIVDEFTRVALANPEVGFSLYQNDLEVFLLKPEKLSQRIVHLFNKNYRNQLIPCEESMEGLSVKGYIGKPEFARKSRGEQFLFVNNRFIKSNYLNHALTTAFEGLISSDQFPFFVLFLEIDPRHIDVNVHPTKTEIKFADEREVYAFLKATVKMAIGRHHVAPALDFSYDTNFRSFELTDKDRQQSADRSYSQYRSSDEGRGSNAQHWERMFEGAIKNESFHAQSQRELEQTGKSVSLRLDSSVNSLGDDAATSLAPSEKSLFQLHNAFVLAQVKSGLMIVDQQAAHERIVYERYKKAWQHASGSCQQLLFPELIELSAADSNIVSDMATELRHIGFSFEALGGNTIALNGLPAGIEDEDAGSLFVQMLEDYKKNEMEKGANRGELLAESIARYTALKRGKRMEREEMAAMIDQLFACSNPNYAPGGRRTYYILESKEIDELFKGR
jgi:DNA mismatch repair protein MutL